MAIPLESLKEFNLEIKILKTLYANPSARICIGGGFSELFDLKRGTWQGDPLSPLIFNISMEPLAQFIRKCPQISPITIGATSHSISLYADDTLVYTADIQQSLPHILKVLEQFGYISRYKVNLAKSALMLLNTDTSKVVLPPRITVMNEVTFLGITINTSLTSIAKTNYTVILKKIAEDVGRWQHLPASVPNRISVIKMNILLRINFFKFHVTTLTLCRILAKT